MKFTCDSCGAAYMISDDKVGPGGVKVRCKKCGNVVTVRRHEEPPVVAPVLAPAATASAGLDDELGSAFDHAFGAAPAAPPAAAAPAVEPARPAAEPAPTPETAAAPASPPDGEWYVAIGDAQVGPLPLAEVRKKWETGDIGPDSLVWRPGMADWAPLSGVADLAAYLSPVPQPAPPQPLPPAALTPVPATFTAAAPARAAAQPAPASSTPSSPSGSSATSSSAASSSASSSAQPSAFASPSAASAPAAGPSRSGGAAVAEPEWRPTGASALAALASEELASRDAAAAPTTPRPAAARALMEQLPDAGGVDPTGAIPLPLKGLEQTGERPARRSSVARGAEELRHKRTMRALFIAVGVLAVVVIGAAWAVIEFTHREPPPAPPALAVAQPPPPAPTPAVEPPPAPAPAPIPAAEPARPDPAAADSAGDPARAPPGKEPPRAAVRPAPAATPARPAPPPARPPAAARPAPAPPPQVAAAPAEKPAASPRKKDSVLDFDQAAEDDLTAALGGGRTAPAAPKAGAAAAPDRLSDAQITEGVKLHVEALRRCAAEQQAREPGAKGTLKMAWTIQPDGTPRDVRCLTPDLAASPFAQCITGVVKGIRFPRLGDARGQPVTFPFGF